MSNQDPHHVQPEKTYSVLIVGGGMVGATMAHALSPLPLRIGVIEAVGEQCAESRLNGAVRM